MLILSGVSKSYGGNEVVRLLDLSIEAAKTYVLIGPSGCGKSTLLRLMLGLISPDSGRVEFAGEDVKRSPMCSRFASGWAM